MIVEIDDTKEEMRLDDFWRQCMGRVAMCSSENIEDRWKETEKAYAEVNAFNQSSSIA